MSEQEPCCRAPYFLWSGVYGDSPRRIYRLCQGCGAMGAVLLPPSDERSFGDRSFAPFHQEVGEALTTLGYRDTFEFLVYEGENWLARRNTFRPINTVAFSHEIFQDAMRKIQRDLREQAQVHEQARWKAHMEEMQRIQKLRDSLRRKVKRVVARRMAKPAPRVKSTKFSLLVTAAEANAAHGVVYGLVDPLDPDRVRYVGQTFTPSARLQQHMKEAIGRSSARLKVNGKRQWIVALHEEGRAPNMVCLERVRTGSDLNARERHWIHGLRAIGQADLNSALPQECRKLQAAG